MKTVNKQKSDSAGSKLSSVLSAPWPSSAIIAGCLALMLLVLYRDFFFGPKTLLFTEFGSDSINVFYPFYVLLSDYLRAVGVPSWSFRIGMGQNLFPYFGNVLLVPVIWLPKAAIATALIYQNALYVLVAGLVFARFLSSRGLNFAPCLLGTVLLCFSAYMCAGSCWYFHAYEVVCLTCLLFAAEKAVSQGRWLYLTLAIVLVSLLGSFHLYLGALLLCFYVPFRLIELHSAPPLLLLRTCVYLGLAAFLGLGLSAVLSIDNFYALLNSPRGSGLTSLVAQLASRSVLRLEDFVFYVTEMLRPFSPDMLGSEDAYRGWYNYFEAPMSYCGLLCLLIFPQIFVGETKRRRILYAVFASALLIPAVFPWFRYLFWAFQGEYFRAFTLFCIFGIITLGVTAFSRYATGRPFNFWILAATILILMGILYFPVGELGTAINRPLRIAVTIFLGVYTLLFVAGQIWRKQNIVAWIVIILCAGELIYVDRITVSARHSVPKKQLAERVGYNDETVDAIQYITSRDQTFFRVSKTWGSSPSEAYPSLNDAMIFGYYGTSAYSSFNNVNYNKFLIALDASSYGDIQSTTHWVAGTLGQPLLSTFVCEKYLLTTNPVPYQMADYYKFEARFNDTYMFRNLMFLPLGLTFSRYIPESTFLQLPASLKGPALFYAAVLPDNAATNQVTWSLLTADELKNEMRLTSLPDMITELRDTAFHILSFSQTRIEGMVHLPTKRILVVQTPFDRGWHARQDRRPAPVVRSDVGLLGVTLDSGDHIVELGFTPPFVVIGAVVSVLSLVLMILIYWRWPRMHLPS